jgi:hypothetical protein
MLWTLFNGNEDYFHNFGTWYFQVLWHLRSKCFKKLKYVMGFVIAYYVQYKPIVFQCLSHIQSDDSHDQYLRCSIRLKVGHY